MSYYFLYQKKGVPSWLAYSFILIMTVAISLTFRGGSTKIISRASKNLIPLNITVSNLTNKSANIYFNTKEPVKTYISVSANNQPAQVLFDYRDQKTQLSRRLHYFELNQLDTNTQYRFSIYVEGKLYEQEQNFATLSLEYPTLSNAPVFGKVVQSNLQPAAEVLVSVKLSSDSQYNYSVLTRASGEWIATLPIVLDNQGLEATIDPNQIINIHLMDENLKQSKITVKYVDTQPLKSVVLGQNYDFTQSDLVLGIKKRAENHLITSPSNNAVISSFYPTFRGQGSKNTLLKLMIKPNVVDLLVSVDKNGNWQYTPEMALSPGQYELIAKNNSEEETITFNIGKSGETVLGEATPSATITLNPTTATSPVITTIPSPTTIPTITTLLISPTIIQDQIPQLGFHNNLLILLASGLSLLGLYLVLY